MTHNFYISQNLCASYIDFLNKYIASQIETELQLVEKQEKAQRKITNFNTKLTNRRQERLELQTLTHELKKLLDQWKDPNTSCIRVLILEQEMANKYKECEKMIRWLKRSWELP